MKVKDVHLTVVRMAQKPPVAPYTSRLSGPAYTYDGSRETRSLICELITDDGISGWGETSGIDPSRLPELESNWRERLKGFPVFDIERFYQAVDFENPSLRSVVEMALWDLLGKATDQPLCNLLGGVFREKVPLAACMGIRPPKEAGEIARMYVAMGFKTLKTKAGRDPKEDLMMVQGIREAVGDALHLRIDANRGYDGETALKLCRELEPYNLQYFEQPCPQDDLEAHARIRRETKVPVALNESVTTLDVVLKAIELQAADVLMPDFPQCGGIWAVKKVAALAEAAGLACVMHCGHDLGVKTAAMVHVAASTPNFPYGNDTTYYSMEDDILLEPFEIKDGCIEVPLNKPGLGADVDREKLAKYAVRE